MLNIVKLLQSSEFRLKNYLLKLIGRYIAMFQTIKEFVNIVICTRSETNSAIWYGTIIHYKPGDLDTRKSTGTSCQIEIHFMIKTTEYLL
jgi:hypothetical protein